MDLTNAPAAAHRFQNHRRQLTAREDILVAWVAMGMCRKQMASTMHRSPKTIEYQLDNVKRKLGFNDPARLTHWAISSKLVELNQIV
jgi:DNA-binding NarL/FixJ family response regulator